MLRNLGAVLLGALVGFGWNVALGILTFEVLFPIPPSLGMDIPDQVGGHIRRLPTAAFLLMMAAHLGQSFFGGWVAARVGASHPMRLALVVGGLSLAFAVLYLRSVRGPDWTTIELPLDLVVAWAAGRIEERRRAGLPSAG